jgi:ABC-2 type transport system permease protein
MKRYLRIFKKFFLSSLMREMEFRVNFFVKAFQNAVWLVFFMLILVVQYSNTEDVAGWGRGDAFVLMATVFIVNALHSGFFFSLTEIPQQVRQGTLDFVVVRPMDTQFSVSMRRFAFEQIGSLIAGLTMVIVGVNQAGVSPSLVQWGSYILLVIAAVLIFYSFMMGLMTLAIWLVRVDNLWVLGESITGIARFPIDIYSSAIKQLFIFGIPLAFISTIPSRQLVHGFEPKYLLLGIAWAVVALFASRKFWRYAMRNYTSASS